MYSHNEKMPSLALGIMTENKTKHKQTKNQQNKTKQNKTNKKQKTPNQTKNK